MKSQYLDTGKARFAYRDYPRDEKGWGLVSAHAARCAGEQGQYWPMHDRLFQAQDEWNGQATERPKPFFKRYAGEVGLDVGKWESCYDARKYQKRINANLADGLRRGVYSTPTFIIGNKMYPGMRNYDELKKLVDSVAKAAPAPSGALGTPAPAPKK